MSSKLNISYALMLFSFLMMLNLAMYAQPSGYSNIGSGTAFTGSDGGTISEAQNGGSNVGCKRNTSFDDFEFTATTWHSTPTGGKVPAIVFRKSGSNYYAVTFRQASHDKSIRLVKNHVDNANGSHLKKYSLSSTSDISIKVRCVGNSIKVDIGNNGSWEIEHTDNSYSTGDIGFMKSGRSNDGCYWNNATWTEVVSCTQPTAPTSITGTTTICSGGTTVLTASGGSNGSGATYEWGTGSTVGGGTIVQNSASASYTTSTLSANQTYWVRRKGTVSPCTNTTGGVTKTVTVQTGPTAPTSITGTTTICSGGTTVLTASGGSNGSGATYEWGTGSTVGGGTIVQNSASASYTTAALGSNTTYWVRRVGNSACTNTTSGVTQAITIQTAPAQPSSIFGNASLCPNATGETYSVTNDAFATSYTWTLPAGWTGTSTTNSITVGANTAGGNISVTATNGCGTSTSSPALAVTVSDLTAGIIAAGQSLCYGATPSALTNSSYPSGGSGTGSYVYQWEATTVAPGTTGFNNITNETSEGYVPGALTSTTWYRRKETSGATCTVQYSNTIEVTVDAIFSPGTISW